MVSKPKSKAQTNRGKPKVENNKRRKSTRVGDAELFKAVIEHSHDAIIFVDSKRRIFYASPSIAQINGYDPEELIGKSGVELTHPDDRETTTQKFLDLLQNPGKSICLEYRLKHKNGSWCWVDVTVTNFLDHPQVRAVVVNIRDITERRYYEDELAQHAGSMSILAEISQQIHTSLDLDMVYENTHQAIRRLMPCDAFIIALLAENKQEIEDVYLWDKEQRWPGEHHPLGKGLTDFIISSGKSLRVNEWDISHDRLTQSSIFGDPHSDTKSVLAMPLFHSNGKCFGMISAQAYAPHAYTAGHEQLMSTLTNQVSKAIENAKLFDELQLELTGRKQTEEALRDSEELHRIILGSISDAVFITDDHGDFIYICSNVSTIFGYSQAEVSALGNIGKLLGDALFDSKEFETRQELQNIEQQVITKTGVQRDLLVNVKRVSIRNGTVLYTCRDITERKKAEQALAESEALYRQAIEVAGAVPYVQSYASSGTGVYFSFIGEGIRQITGYGPEEFNDELWDSITQERALVEDLAGYSWGEAVRRVRSGENPIWKCEHRIRHRNGEIRWVFEAAVELRDEHGVSHGSIGMYQDITARKHAEAALRESQQRLSLFFNQSLDGFFFSMIDEPIEWNDASNREKLLDYVISHQHITEANNAMIEQYGSTREKFIGRTANDFFAHDLEQGRRFRRNLFTAGRMHLETEERKDDGTPIWIEGDYVCMYDPQNRITGMFGIQRDITSRKNADEVLREAENKYRNLVERLTQVIYTSELGSNGVWSYVSPQIEKLLGFTPQEWMNNSGLWYQQVHPDDRDIQQAVEEQAFARNEPFESEYRILTRTGSWIWVRDSGHIFPSQGYGPPIVQGMLMDITERKQAEAAVSLSKAQLRANLENTPHVAVQWYDKDGRILYLNPASESLYGWKSAEAIGKTLNQLILTSEEQTEFMRILAEISKTGNAYGPYESHIKNRAGEDHWVLATTFSQPMSEEQVGFVCMDVDITARKQAEDSLRKAEAKYRMLVEQIPPIIYLALPGKDVGVTYISPQIKTLGFTEEEWIADPKLWLRQIHPDDQAKVMEYIVQISQSGEPYKLEYRLRTREGVVRWFIDEVKDIVDETGNILFRQGFMLDITERKQAEEQKQKQLRRLNALHTIDMAINSSANIQITLEVLLNQTLSQLNVDAADVLLFNQPAQTLELIASRGFRSNIALQSHQRLGEGLAGRVINERRTIHISNLTEAGKNLRQISMLVNDSFTEYFGVPLIAKGQLKGVLEIYHRTPLSPDDDWLNFLEVLAGQSAIAIDNSQLLQGLQRSNMELVLAYDATIEGWSRAMDLRDKETEGHTQRVTTMTLKLARAMGIREADIIYIQRGGLLHDIGKLGVPDGILLKPGKLTEEEWEIMRQHPTYALNMLSPIIYLKQALDIPYCHHEKWDGTGYPQGLKGEQIPLAARIFAVIDVWDALTSDRPYRKAWTKEQTIEFIKEQSEKHFDPQVVKAFLEMISMDG